MRLYVKDNRVTDKMPFNFLWAGLIHASFPRATIIHCRRSAVDTALSIHRTHFHAGLVYRTSVARWRRYEHWLGRFARSSMTAADSKIHPIVIPPLQAVCTIGERTWVCGFWLSKMRSKRLNSSRRD